MSTVPESSGVSRRELVELDDVNDEIKFAESPFYNIDQKITPFLWQLEVCRGQCIDYATFILPQEITSLLGNSEEYKLYLFSGEEQDIYDSGTIASKFLHPIEIRINGNILHQNLRGSKNKKGTANPADLTQFITGGSNILELEHYETVDNFLIMCAIVSTVSINKLLAEVLEENDMMTIENSLKLLTDDNTGLEAFSTLVSLKCPISYIKLKYPLRSKNCFHIECFDALSFLSLQQQIPTWKCPYCNSQSELEDLVICELTSEILESCDEENVDCVKIYSDGSWEEILADTDTNDSSGEFDDCGDESSLPLDGAVEILTTDDEPEFLDLESVIKSVSDLEHGQKVDAALAKLSHDQFESSLFVSENESDSNSTMKLSSNRTTQLQKLSDIPVLASTSRDLLNKSPLNKERRMQQKSSVIDLPSLPSLQFSIGNFHLDNDDQETSTLISIESESKTTSPEGSKKFDREITAPSVVGQIHEKPISITSSESSPTKKAELSFDKNYLEQHAHILREPKIRQNSKRLSLVDYPKYPKSFSLHSLIADADTNDIPPPLPKLPGS